MGKRLALDNPSIPSKKKRLNGYRKQKRKNSNSSVDQQSSDDDSKIDIIENSPLTKKIDLSLKENDSSPKPIYQLSGDIVNGTILTDIKEKQWRIGKPVGKGSFGEIFLASDNVKVPVTKENAKYVVKIEPHSNGPLFVEIHCLINVNKNNDEKELTPPGVPSYIASGSHYFRNERYRFLVLPRFDRELHSIIKHCRVSQKSLIVLAVQILDILQILHDRGYCHSDIKAENLMISNCTYRKSLVMHYKSKDIESDNESMEIEDDSNGEGRSNNEDSDSENNSENNDENAEEESDSAEEEEEEESDDEISNHHTDSESNYKTPINNRRLKRNFVQFSGSNPVRSCRSKNSSANTTYQEMVSSHYLRPSRKVNYSSFFNDDNSKSPSRDHKYNCNIDNDDSSTNDDYVPNSCRLKFRNSINNSLLKSNRKLNTSSNHNNNSKINHSCLGNTNEYISEDRLFLIDYGLASKFVDACGIHRPFCMDQRRAHDGTLEFTSRDAHMGAHSRRSDLECLGYNLIFWSQGFLPWREKAALQQPEKVHGMKEYLMADVRQMLKHIYGKQVPKYLGEYMYYVGKLAYDERPDYEKLKMIFLKVYKKMDYKVEQIKLDLDDLIKNSINVKKELQDKNMLEMKNIKSIMKNLGVIMPFQESNVSRVSPKNLRSKEKNSCKKKKKFSWAEILSQDPDQIARERAEKEFERDSTETPVIRFKGKPTYAILEIQNRLKKFKERIESVTEEDDETENLRIKGYNKQMIDILKKRQQSLFADVTNSGHKKIRTTSNNNQNNVSFTTPLKEPNRRSKDIKRLKETANSNSQEIVRTRNKEGLRTTITPTKRSLDYTYAKQARKRGPKKINLEDVNCSNSSNNNSNTNGIINPRNGFIGNKDKNRPLGATVKALRSTSLTNSSTQATSIIKTTNSYKSNHNNNSGCELSGTDDSSCSSSSIHSISSLNENSRSSGVSSRKSTRSKSSSNSSSASTSSSMAAAAVTVAQSSSATQKILCRYQQTLKTVVENENSNSSTSSNSSTNSNSSCNTTNSNNSFPPASLSDEDTRDVMVSFPPRSTIKSKTRNVNNNNINNKPPISRVRIRINGTASIVKELSPMNVQQKHPVIINGNNSVTNGNINSSNRRKKSIPQKRNVKSEYLRCV